MAREAQCPKYENNKIRCLSKKQCEWRDAPGEDVTRGLCLYKDIAENQIEMEKYKSILEFKENCLNLLTKYSDSYDLHLRSQLNNDTSAAAELAKSLEQYEDSILKLKGCLESSSEDHPLKLKKDKDRPKSNAIIID